MEDKIEFKIGDIVVSKLEESHSYGFQRRMMIVDLSGETALCQYHLDGDKFALDINTICFAKEKPDKYKKK